MYKVFITTSNLIAEEPNLLHYLENGSIDLDEIIRVANEYVINDLSNRGIQLKKICTPLYITNGSVVEDKIERKRFVIEVTNISNSTLVELKGRNKLTEPFEVVFNDLSISDIGEYSKLITNPYSYYQLNISNVSGLEYKAYLIENVFDLPLIKYALYLAYKRLQVFSGDVYIDKANMYKEEYKMLMESITYSYNVNLSADVVVTTKYNKVTFRR